MKSKRIIYRISHSCCNCGSENEDLIHADNNCTYNHLGKFVCIDCCERCDWIDSCATFRTWEAAFYSKNIQYPIPAQRLT